MRLVALLFGLIGTCALNMGYIDAVYHENSNGYWWYDCYYPNGNPVTIYDMTSTTVQVDYCSLGLGQCKFYQELLDPSYKSVIPITTQDSNGKDNGVELQYYHGDGCQRGSMFSTDFFPDGNIASFLNGEPVYSERTANYRQDGSYDVYKYCIALEAPACTSGSEEEDCVSCIKNIAMEKLGECNANAQEEFKTGWEKLSGDASESVKKAFGFAVDNLEQEGGSPCEQCMDSLIEAMEENSCESCEYYSVNSVALAFGVFGPKLKSEVCGGDNGGGGYNGGGGGGGTRGGGGGNEANAGMALAAAPALVLLAVAAALA